MSALTTQEPRRDMLVFTADDEKLIRETIARDATDSEFKLFLYQCKKTGLDPLAKQIYFQKRGGKMVIITGIDGYRLTADRTNKYAGNDDPVFDDEQKPGKATVTVYKLISGVRCPYTASARWEQYYPGDQAGQMWRKMPHLMLGKCAEALALRKAFPAELSGMYVREEMDQAGSIDGAHEGEPAASLQQYGEAENRDRAQAEAAAERKLLENKIAAQLNRVKNAGGNPGAILGLDAKPDWPKVSTPALELYIGTLEKWKPEAAAPQ